MSLGQLLAMSKRGGQAQNTQHGRVFAAEREKIALVRFTFAAVSPAACETAFFFTILP